MKAAVALGRKRSRRRPPLPTLQPGEQVITRIPVWRPGMWVVLGPNAGKGWRGARAG